MWYHGRQETAQSDKKDEVDVTTWDAGTAQSVKKERCHMSKSSMHTQPHCPKTKSEYQTMYLV